MKDKKYQTLRETKSIQDTISPIGIMKNTIDVVLELQDTLVEFVTKTLSRYLNT